jgi:hypothetical protein
VDVAALARRRKQNPRAKATAKAGAIGAGLEFDLRSPEIPIGGVSSQSRSIQACFPSIRHRRHAHAESPG